MVAGHVGGSQGFIDEHEPFGIEIELAIEPVLPLAQDVGAVLLDRMASLFYASCRDERRSGEARRNVQAELYQRRAKFFKRDVLARLPHRKDLRPSLLDPMRAHVAALRLGSKAAGRAPLRKPADRRRWRYAEPGRCRSATHPVIDRCQKPAAQIHR
jgi:hypothetical protein